jgi:glycosidase
MKKKISLLLLMSLIVLTNCNINSVIVQTPAPIVNPTNITRQTEISTSIPISSPTPIKSVPIQPIVGLPSGTDGFPWWNDTVFYEIFVRSFSDSNGDGIGDFNGITQKLDYLQNLGITGIWLMPINPSPSYHGYDVTDYLSVNPDYGTLEDFHKLITEAHLRGIRVIIDLVLNHTSDQHPWFKSAQDTHSTFHDYYIWSDTNPNFSGPWNQQVWYKSQAGWYYALFWEHMPDLNYNNPNVTNEIENITMFWLNQGIDGFRLDAAKHLVEDGTQQANTGMTHEWYKKYRPFYKGIKPDALTIGEISGDDPAILASYTQGDQLDLTFDFGQAKGFMDSAFSGQNFSAYGGVKLGFKLIPHQQYATFLTNHDQNRAMSQFNGNEGIAKVAATMVLTSTGVPFIYYGEEIGMTGVKPDEDIRRPMQWNDGKNAGFSAGTPWRSPDQNYLAANVKSETNQPGSLLKHYQTLILLRNQHGALRIGDIYTIRSENTGIFATLRVSKQEVVMVVVNLTANPIQDISLSISKSPLSARTYSAIPLTGSVDISNLIVDENGAFSNYKLSKEIPAYHTVILQLR